MIINKFFSWVRGLVSPREPSTGKGLTVFDDTSTFCEQEVTVEPYDHGVEWVSQHEPDKVVVMDSSSQFNKAASPREGDREVVLVVSEDSVSQYTEGKTSFLNNAHPTIFLSSEWMYRDEAETNPKYRQVIPYVLLRTGKKYWVYDRTSEGGEGRLHGLSSLGWGGHINPEDSSIATNAKSFVQESADACVDRELAEELGLEDALFPSKYSDLGALVSYDSEVDRVHLGLVSIWDVPAPEELDLKLEPSISNLRLMTLTQLRAEKKSFESWSQIVINNLNSKV